MGVGSRVVEGDVVDVSDSFIFTLRSLHPPYRQRLLPRDVSDRSMARPRCDSIVAKPDRKGYKSPDHANGIAPRGDTRTPPNAADRPQQGQQGQQAQQNGGVRPPGPQQARQGSNKPAAAASAPAPATTA